MTDSATYRALQGLARPLQWRSQAGWLARAVGSVMLLLGATAWLARVALFSAPYWVLVAWGVALLAAGWTWHAARAARSKLSLRQLALRLEALGAWRHGVLTSLLDSAATGTSDALLDVADRSCADELWQRGRLAIEPIARLVRAQAAVSALVLAMGSLALISAGPRDGVASALWHPRKAWEATVAPVTIGVARAVVDRGDSVDFDVRAVGRTDAILWLRAPGESWRSRTVGLDTLGRAVVTVGPLETDLFARVTSGSRRSDTLRIRVRLPVLLGSLTLIAHYPAYLDLENESLPTGGDTLFLPAGTSLETRGEATAPLADADWQFGADAAPLQISGTRFAGTFTPRTSEEYRLALGTADGTLVVGDTVRLTVQIVADSAPHIEIPVPGGDTVAPLSLLVPIVIDARDDHGLGGVVLESRRISHFGLVDSVRREPVMPPGERTNRAILPFTLDLNQRGLLPGDTIRYFAVAVDNAPRPQAAQSREFILRLPTLSEVRAAQRQATATLARRLDSAVVAGRRIERQTEDLAREQPRNANGSGRNGASLGFEQARRAEPVAQAQQQLEAQAEQVRQALETLRRSAEAGGTADSAWERQLAEIGVQLDRALSPELREKLAALQQALKELSAERTKQALEQLAAAQQQLREALERSRELFRRAAIEGDLANLTRESRDLAGEQRQWNEQALRADSLRAATEERLLAARADSLDAALDRLGDELKADGRQRQKRIESAAAQARQAAQQMRQATRSAGQGQRTQARRQGEQAERALQPVGDQLQQERQQLQQGWREEIVQAMDRALAETSHLAERQLALHEQLDHTFDPKGSIRVEQAAVEKGVRVLLEQMRRAAGKNALLRQQIGTALAAARQQMRAALEAVSSATPNTREAFEQAGRAVDALNAAAHGMLRARGDVAGSASASGLAEALEQLAHLAQQQGGLGAQGAGLLPMAASGAIEEPLRQLGVRQRALAEQLERLHGGGNMPGTGEIAEEAKDLARRLESGYIDRPIVERQERLFHRMLDAGRTLQGWEDDRRKDRYSMTATDDSVHLPPALRARLADDSSVLRLPSWEELQRLSVEERRLVMDYFRRLAEIRER